MYAYRCSRYFWTTLVVICVLCVIASAALLCRRQQQPRVLYWGGGTHFNKMEHNYYTDALSDYPSHREVVRSVSSPINRVEDAKAEFERSALQARKQYLSAFAERSIDWENGAAFDDVTHVVFLISYTPPGENRSPVGKNGDTWLMITPVNLLFQSRLSPRNIVDGSIVLHNAYRIEYLKSKRIYKYHIDGYQGKAQHP